MKPDAASARLLSDLFESVYNREDLPVEGDVMRTRPESGEKRVEGRVMKGRRKCTLEGCGGVRIYVRWPKGHTTQPCSEGVIRIGSQEARNRAGIEGVWQII